MDIASDKAPLTDLLSQDRLAQGYVMVLPGIEGHSLWNRSIVSGLLDAGIPYGIEIYDWTWTRSFPLINLRYGGNHRSQSDRIAARITEYRRDHPSTPLYLIGHSGGGAMTLFSLPKLPEGVSVTGGILLGPAVSPVFDLQPAMARTTRGLWNFSSVFDLVFLAFGTTLFGTCDGHHQVSAGCLGFRKTEPAPAEPLLEPYYREIPYRLEMMRSLNLGGHFGYVNRYFVAQWLAPILRGEEIPLHALRRIARLASEPTISASADELASD